MAQGRRGQSQVAQGRTPHLQRLGDIAVALSDRVMAFVYDQEGKWAMRLSLLEHREPFSSTTYSDCTVATTMRLSSSYLPS